MNDTTLDQRVQDAARDALQLVARNPAADRDVAARLVANAVLAELHRQPVTVPPWAAIATASAPWGTCQDCGAAAGPDCDCPPQDEQQEQPVHACPPGCPGCNAPGGIGECGPEDQPAPAPRNALSGPQTAEPPAPGPERHPGGENGPHTGTQDRAELCRRFEAALTRQWGEVARFVMDDVLRDVVDCHLELVARATAELRAELAIDTQVMEKADRECDEHIAAGRAFRQLAEQAQAWGEQHRDRANRYRTRVDRARRRLDAWEQQLPETVLTATVLEVLRGDLAPQAGDDTTGATP